MSECPGSPGVFAYLVDPSDRLADGIRDHLADCIGCTELMGRLLTIEEGLSMEYEFEDPEHPASEVLLAYQKNRELPAADRTAIEVHVASCAKCESELSALSRFDFARAAALARVGRPSATPTTETSNSESIWSRIRTWIGAADVFSPSPAYALALLLILVPVAVYTFVNQTDGPGEPIENFASNHASEDGLRIDSGQLATDAVRAESPERGERSDARSIEMVAELGGRISDQERDASNSPLRADADPERVALIEAPVTGARPEALLLDTRNEPSADDVILLASLDQWSTPRYRAPSDMDYFDASPMRVRASDGMAKATPRVITPGHVVETVHESPTLYWSLDRESTAGVEITLVRQGAGEVVLEVEDPGPTASGLHAISLRSHAVGLEIGSEYRVYVSLVLDPKRRSRDRRASGALRRVVAPAGLSAATRSSDSLGHAYASLGLWVDAVQFFVELSEGSPNSEAARKLRDQFLEEADPSPRE